MKSYSESIPTETDPYYNIPLIHFFALICDINYTLFHRWYGQSTLEDDGDIVYYDKVMSEIPMCKEHGLVVSQGIPISNLNMSELLSALDLLESKMHRIGYCQSLVMYLEALELRVDEFILCDNLEEYHNVVNLRAKHPRRPGYVCTTYCEYILAVRILSIKRDFEGCLDYLRDHEECIRPTYPEELGAVTMIHSNLLVMAQHIHTDMVQDDFSESYEANSVRSSVGYQWLKENKYSDVPEPLGAVTQFEGDAYWKNVCVQSNIEVDEHFYTMENPAAFWIIFFQLTELVIMSCLENDWVPSKAPDDTGAYVTDYFITNNTLKILNGDELDMLMMRSKSVPIFLQSFSDASILFQEKLYVFGHSPLDYLRAFHSWVDIIENCFDGMFLGRIPIHKLRAKIYNPDTTPSITKYVTKTHSTVTDKFTMSLQQKTAIARDARISSLLSSQQSSELSTGSNAHGDEPFLAEANTSMWD